MKKTFSLVVSLVLVLSCFAAATLFASAGEYDYLDLRPVEDGDAQYSASGATIEVESNGTVIITLTAASAEVEMTYKNTGAVYQEAYVNVEEAHYVRYYFEKSNPAMGFGTHAYYDRGNKDNADLYLTGMEASGAYYKVQGDNYGVWDMYTYLSERAGYMPEDKIIKFSTQTYTITGNVGDILTLYYFDIADSYDDDFGTVPPDSGIIDTSESPSQAEEPTSEPAASVEEPSGPAEESSQSPVPPTGDIGIAALAVVSVIALAGVVAIKRK